MPDILTQHNIGALGDLVRMSDHFSATAGGAGNNATFTGISLDRMGFGLGALARTALVGVLYEATLASGKTLSLGYDLQHAPDNATWTDFQTATGVVVATGVSGGTTAKGEFNFQVDLTSAQRYIRFNTIPNLSATGVDTCYGDVAGFVAGFERLAAPNI